MSKQTPSTDRFADDEFVVVRIYLREKPPAAPLLLRCRIVWGEEMERGYRLGAQFHELPDADRQTHMDALVELGWMELRPAHHLAADLERA